MPAKTHVVKAVFLVLCLCILALQYGCSASGGGDAQAPAGNGNDINLSLTTTTGFTAIVADGQSTIPIRMLVTNATGAGRPNVSVTFATTAGSLSTAPVVRVARDSLSVDGAVAPRVDEADRLTVSTDANGIAQVLLTAGTRVETAVVTADAQGFRSNIVIAFVAAATARVQLSASPTTVGAGATSTITATATDSNGNLVEGETVTFTLSTNTSGATLSPASQVTGANGQATVLYTAGFIAGADTVQAQATSGVVGMISITVTPAPAGTVTTVEVVAGSSSIIADGTSSTTIRATVTGAMGPVPGVPVTFTTDAGRLSAPMAVTNGSGVAAVNLIAASSLGTAMVTATAEGVSNTATVMLVAGAPATIVLNATPAVVNAGATAMLVATVLDANANPVAGYTLVLSLPTNASGATLSLLIGMTDANGQLPVLYTAGVTLGTDIVQARATNGIVGTTTLTVAVRSALVGALTVASGAPRIAANGADSTTIRATVSDAAMGGAPGILVTFTTTAGSLSAMTATTDSNGIATVTLTAGTTIGMATVRASAGGLSATTMVIFEAAAPSTVMLLATPATVAAGATAVIRVAVTDANGNPAAMQTLTLALVTNVSGATLSALTGVTDVNGRLTVTYTAGSILGADIVRAQTTTGASGMVTVTVSALATNVADVTVDAGTTMLPADGTSRVAIRATVRDAMGVGLSGVEVTFTSTAGTLPVPPTAMTDASGVAQVDLIAASSLGMATVTATAGGFSDSVTIDFIAGPPAVVSLSANPSTVNVRGMATIQVTVTDTTGNPTAGQALILSFTTNASGATLNPLTGLTDSSGQLIVTYMAGQTPGTDVVSARANSLTGTVSGTVSIAVTLAAGASSIDLLVSSPQLNSGGVSSVTLTALVRNATNNVVSGATVNFTASSGGIQIINGITGAAGTATALLTTGGDPANRSITVTATTGTLSDTNIVDVTGTTLSLSGATSLVLTGVTRLSILLRDSAGVGIANRFVMLQSMRGNTLSAAMVLTDFTGGASVDVTASVAGMDTITASALGAMGSALLSVSADNFVFTLPVPNPQMPPLVPLGTAQQVTVHWDVGAPPVPQVGRTVNFSATRGMLSAPTAVTDASGNATVTISSLQAGPAVITASVAGGPSSQVSIEFLAINPSALVVQAVPTTLGVNAAGSTAQQSVITAIVQDVSGNLVKNQTVSFSLTDTTGGFIFPASAVTDSFGRASTVYTAGAAPSALNGVSIEATVLDSLGIPIRRTASLTIAQQALFVILGTGNLIQTPSNTQYAQPYSVIVTDANGNPIANATIELSVLPTRYQKGRYITAFTAPDPPATPVCTGSWFKDPLTTITCPNEDLNLNGRLDLLPVDEDTNNNGRLDPGNVAATVPGRVVTNATGFAFFDVVYARQFTWVEVMLEARTTVAGSESSSGQVIFFLPGLASDFSNCNVSPPGQTSPYGTAATCDNPN